MQKICRYCKQEYVGSICPNCGVDPDLDMNFSFLEGNLAKLSHVDNPAPTVVVPQMFQGRTVVEIGKDAFRYYKNKVITQIVLPQTVTRISHKAFGGCENLKSLTLPPNLQWISSRAFLDCKSLVSMHLPKDVTVDGSPWDGCENLQKLTVDADSKLYKSMDGVLYSRDGKQLICYPAGRKGKEYAVLDGVEKICPHAFYGSKLQRVYLPQGLKHIGIAAFCGCCNLQEMDMPQSLVSIDYDAFAGCVSLLHVSIPKGTFLGENLFYNCPKNLVVQRF